MKLRIIDGNFLEGERVIVSLNGNIISRVVHWDAQAKDLYIVYKNRKYFLYEFMKGNTEYDIL
jgi:hypothetical protein